MEFQPGTILKDRYAIIRLLGEGGMGAVYLAEDRSLSHEIAVKVNQSSAAFGTTQFMREARLLAALRHPHLPRVIDYFMLDENQVLVMDYVPGEDLRQVIEGKRTPGIEQVLEWAKQLGSALDYIHNQDPPVTHRDIKPENIKLTEDGEVMLVDFGIAKAAEATQATEAGAQAYTSGYAPPEQYGGGRTGPYSDQYSFAATLYHLLTGFKPVDSIERVLDGAVLAPCSTLNAEIPRHVQDAIHCAMSVRPQDRFASVSKFVAVLQDPAFRTTRQYRVGDQSIPTISQPAPGLIPIKNVSAPPKEKIVPAESRRRLSPWLIITGIVVILALVLGAGGIGYFLLTNNNTLEIPTTDPLVAIQQVQQTTVAATIAYETPTFTSTITFTPTITPTPTATYTLTPTMTYSPTATPPYKPVGEGGMVVFVSDRADGATMQLWSMQVGLNVFGELASTGLEQITYDAVDKQDPAWSPDGTQLLYAAPGEDPVNGLDIWLMDFSDPERVAEDITNRPGDETQPCWSPDGSRIVYNLDENGTVRIFSMQPDGSDPHLFGSQLDAFSEFSPAFSPDAVVMLFTTDDRGVHSLVVRKSYDDYSSRSPFASMPQSPYDVVADPAWSPDGGTIVFTGISEGESKIYSVPDSSKIAAVTELTKQTNAESQSAWSPDSEYILFSSEREEGNPEIYIMTATGLLQKNLSEHAGRDISPAWQP